MANRYAKIEERLDALERAHAPKGRFIVHQFVVDEADPQCDAFIAAEQERLEREYAPIMPADHIQVLARVIVHPPDYDENGNAIPGTGSKSSTVKR